MSNNYRIKKTNELYIYKLLSIIPVMLSMLVVSIFLTSCHQNYSFLYPKETSETNEINEANKANETTESYKLHGMFIDNEVVIESNEEVSDVDVEKSKEAISEESNELVKDPSGKYFTKKIYLDMSYPYATFSVINDGFATLYILNPDYIPTPSSVTNIDINSPQEEIEYIDSIKIKKKNKTIAINAGHGTKGGEYVKTYAHPDFSPRVSGGTNKEGSTKSLAVSDGTKFKDGMRESVATLRIAKAAKDKLLDAGYDVLMIRETDDLRLDNVARTVIANENADMHIAIHFDSTDYDKGIFYIIPYNNESYLNMEPLKSNINNIYNLGVSMLRAYRNMGFKIWKDRGTLQGDLTQLSFSTNPSIDLELGDKATIINDESVEKFAQGILNGIELYYSEMENVGKNTGDNDEKDTKAKKSLEDE